MAKYFYGSELYNDLFLNNNREMYVKMLLVDFDEPEITEFYIRDGDYSATVGATRLLIPGEQAFTQAQLSNEPQYANQKSFIEVGDIITTEQVDLDGFPFCKITDSPQIFYSEGVYYFNTVIDDNNFAGLRLGYGQGVSFPFSSATLESSALTFAFAIKRMSAPSPESLLIGIVNGIKVIDNGNYIYLKYPNGTLVNFGQSLKIETGVRSFITITVSGFTAKAYKNGELVYTDGTFNIYSPATGQTTIYLNRDPVSETLKNGDNIYSHVIYYTRALSDAEVVRLFYGTYPQQSLPPLSPPAAIYMVPRSVYGVEMGGVLLSDNKTVIDAMSLQSGDNSGEVFNGYISLFTNFESTSLKRSAMLPISGVSLFSVQNGFYQTRDENIQGVVGQGGTYFQTNKYNKLIVVKKAIQGQITQGSLKVDGNSPIRRTIDFTAIVDKEFGENVDLKIHDFDTKKVKLLIGIKDNFYSEYDYSEYFSENGAQKDSNGIIWFKLGTFIPRNVSIKHSTDSYSISITAQDKMSSLDGSFGGVLGTGLEFKDPKTSENTSFYETIYNSIENFTDEPIEKINIKFSDDFSIFKYAPETGEFITAGSTFIWVKDSSSLYEGMEISGPGIFTGTKIKTIVSGTTRSKISIDYPAYQTTNANENISFNNTILPTGLTFSFPSYKNNFAIQPLVSIDDTSQIYFKKTQINFKNSDYSPTIYTTISNWESSTWGDPEGALKKPTYENIIPGRSATLTGQDPNFKTSAATGRFLSTFNFKSGDVIFTPSSIGSFNGLLPSSFYQVQIITGEDDMIYLKTLEPIYQLNMHTNTTTTGNGFVFTNKESDSIDANFLISGTFNATISFEYSIDTSTWLPLTVYNSLNSPLTSTTLTGTFSFILTKNYYYRARVSVYTSGSINVIFTRTSTVNLTGKAALINQSLIVQKFDADSIFRLKGYFEEDDSRNKLFLDSAYDYKNDYLYTIRKYIWSPQELGITKNRFETTVYNVSTGKTVSYNQFYTNDEFAISSIAVCNGFYFTADNSRSIIVGSTKSADINESRQMVALDRQNSGTNNFRSIGSFFKLGDALFVRSAGSLTALTDNTLYYITSVNNDLFQLSNAITNQPVTVSTTVTITGDLYSAPYTWVTRAKSVYGPFTDSVTSMVCCRKDDSLIVSFGSSGLAKFKVNSNGSLTLALQLENNTTMKAKSLASDSFGNIYALFNNIIVKYNYLLTEIKRIDISNIFSDIISYSELPEIVSISCNSLDDISLLTSGVYKGLNGQNLIYNYNFIILDSETFNIKNKTKFYDPLAIYNKSALITGENNFFYFRIDNDVSKSMLVDLLEVEEVSSINAFKQFAPQTDSTIVKDSSETVASILEDIKGQLGSFQYFYDTDGNLNFKEDKRLVFSDPNFSKLNPYDFNFENYNINTDDVPFVFDFIKNNQLLVEANNVVDLSSFKNDFFVYGTKKGLEESPENINTQMLYHIMLDDLSIKNTAANYKHPWQQYIIDQGNSGFIYYKELKENFEFKKSRAYFANPSYRYVEGEFVLVSNTQAGVSSASSYSLYEVITGGTPSINNYPFQKDGSTIEYLNSDLASQTGFSVRFYGNVYGVDYESYQGIYSKIYDSNTNKKVPIWTGCYFTEVSTQNQVEYVYQITSIYQLNTFTGQKTPINNPVSINFNGTNIFQINPSYIPLSPINKTLYSSNSRVDLGGLADCTFEITCLGRYNSNTGYKGIFRSANSGNFSNDFNFSSYKDGDPGSWTYYFDIVNIAGNYITDSVTQKQIPVGITNWAPNQTYQVKDFVYSDNKIYECLLNGTSGTSAPQGFGDEDNLIRDYSAGTKLTWKLNQISIDFNKMKVSSIGSRKSAVFDKDINTLFSPKEALAYFYTSGYYFIVINDFLGYESYSETFHKGLESLIRQINILYPNIVLIIVPQSQIESLFVISELTRLKDAYSAIKKNFYLNFVNGQSINISSVPIYTFEPLGIIKVGDESSDLYGSFLLTDFSIPLSNEGSMMLTAVKTHPYDDNLTVLPEALLYSKQYSSQSAIYSSTNVYR